MNQKQLPTIDERAAWLVEEAKQVSQQYYLTSSQNFASIEQVRDALEYGYILGKLTAPADSFWQKEIVAAALKQRFDMSDEEFATSILGG